MVTLKLLRHPSASRSRTSGKVVPTRRATQAHRMCHRCKTRRPLISYERLGDQAMLVQVVVKE